MPVVTGSGLPDFLQGTALTDTISGLGADDVVHAFDGADLVFGGTGDDVVYAGSGDDTIDAGAGEDIIYGQSGNDLLSYATATTGILLMLGDPVASTGDAAGDVFTSIERFELTVHNDRFIGSALSDRVNGGAGDDHLSGLDGNDLLQGGIGNDMLCGGLGADTLDGGVGYDFASYADSLDNLRLDFVDFLSSSPEVAGDVFIGIEGYILGIGHDVALAVSAARFLGGAGDDSLTGGAGGDWLFGDQGQDVLYGGNGSDRIEAGDDPDPVAALDLNPSALGAIAAGGAGHDTLTGGNMPDSLAGDTGQDSLAGGAANDSLDGGAGNDTLAGDTGDDWLLGGAGRDVLIGGIGTDTAVYAAAVTFNKADSALSTGEAMGDSLTGIERLLFQGTGSTYVGATSAMAMEFQATGGLFRAGIGAETVAGNGTDTQADYSAAARALVFVATLSGISGTGGHAAGDRLTGIATLTAGGFGDRITLSAPASTLDQVYGGDGADVFVISASGVALSGGTGNDTITGSFAGGTRAQPVVLAGNDGNDTFQISKVAGAGTDWVRLDGGIGTDRLVVQNTGGASILGSVEAWGGDGNDTMTLRALAVLAEGGAGNDTISATSWGSTLDGGTGNDRIVLTLQTATQARTMVMGGDGDDVLTVVAGFAQADALERLSEVHLSGGAGQDLLTGSAPVLAPGTGALLLREVFVFAPGDGQDTVNGFDDGADRIAFGAGGPQSMADLVITESATGTQIAYGSDLVVISGLAPADVSAADFLFA